MSIAATYASATSFTVATDLTADFTPGRAIRADCGADGIKYGYVSYSAYGAPNTTVNLESTDSQEITANLVTVMFSRIKAKEAGGNTPIQEVWMNRGFKSGMTLTWKDADEIYVDSGALHIDNGTAENIYCAQSQLTKQLTSLSASTWYAIYVDPPDNGLTLAAADIEYSTTMPTYDQAKRGWYHGTNTDWRCIGFIYSDSGSAIARFDMSNNFMNLNSAKFTIAASEPLTTDWTDKTVPAPAIAGLQAHLRINAYRVNTTNSGILWRPNGSDETGRDLGATDSSNVQLHISFIVVLDSAGVVEFKESAGNSANVYFTLVGLYLPKGM